MDHSPYLTTAEVASHLRVDAQTVRRWCLDGSLQAVRVGKAFRVHRDELTKFARPAAAPR